MQTTRQLILEYLKEHGTTTVEALAKVLRLTTVTVRHHLDILRSEDLIGEPIIQHRTSRGRPQYMYGLTNKASAHFPKNYVGLTDKLLTEIKTRNARLANVIFEGVAQQIASEAPKLPLTASVSMRLDSAVAFLNDRGYIAQWEKAADGYLLHTRNCPYETLAMNHPELCHMDMTIVGNLLGQIPERVARLADGSNSCTYRFHDLSAHR
jgi:predicted ArsR family transcriptional regulator